MRFEWLCLAVWVLVGCGPVSRGRVEWSVSGGDGAEIGFLASQLSDGWAVQFSKYLVAVGGMSLSQNDVTESVPGQTLVDLTQGRTVLERNSEVTAGRWNVGYAISPVEEDAVIHASVTPVDADRMRTQGWSILISGQGIKSGVGTVSFEFGFPVSVRMSECTNGVDGTLGIVVPENGVAQAEMSIHAEHLFFDKLGTHRSVGLRFEPIAAAAGSDSVVTLDELAEQDIFSLKDFFGNGLLDAQGQPVLYSPGSYDVRNLQQFLTRSVLDQAHLNGGGLCTLSLE